MKKNEKLQKRVKGTLCGVLALATAASMTACTKKEAETENTRLTWYVNSNPLNDVSQVVKKVNEITEDKLGVTLDLKLIDDGAFSERMRMYMATGQKFDLCFTGYVNPYLSAVKNGGLMELTELIDKEAPKLLDAVPDYAIQASTVDGGLYAVPNMQNQALEPCFYIRKEVAEKYGLDKIDSFESADEIEPYLEKMLSDFPDKFPINGAPTEDIMLRDNQKINEYAYVNKNDFDHKVLYTYEMPEYEECLKRANRYYTKGYVRSDYSTAKDNMQSDMKAGKYCVTTGLNSPGAKEKYESEYNTEVHIITYSQPYLASTHILDAMTGISAESENPEKAIKLLELVNTDKELLNLMQYGIEGTHYEKIDDKYVKLTNRDNYYLDAWKFGNTFISYLLEGQPENYSEECKRINNESEKPVFIGFNVNSDLYKNEYAQCEAIRKEYDTGTLMTTSDYKPAFAELKSRLEQAGVKTMIESIQAQLDEWWDANK